MNSHTRRCTRTVLGMLLLVATITAAGLQAQAQRMINDADRVTLPGNVHPSARIENDRGSADPNMPMKSMVLSLAVRPAAQAALDQLLKDQQDPKSPRFHKWITPQQFGAQFGPTDQDIADASGWLKSHGFRIDNVANGRLSITFSGNVRQVEQAFQTNIRNYVVNGETHFANATDPSIPRALADLVLGVVSLHNFAKHRNSNVHQLPPDFTDGVGSHFLAPADFAKIYDVSPLYAAGIDGTGQTIAIVGRTDINLADVQFFRSFFGLPVNDPQFIHNGADPGIVNIDEQREASLDVEWSGAIARNATIKFVISQSGATDGVDLSAGYIVNNNLANIMSTSFGQCERILAANNTFWGNLWSQAATQGITSFVSSGDNGAAGCDLSNAASGTGRAVSGLASTPNNIAVGGTQFNEGNGNFWAAGNNPADQSSVLSYIPEVVWNESGNVPGGSGLLASSGGVSTIYAKPAWQTGTGVPADGFRDLPDVSLSAAGHDGYLIILNHTANASGLAAVGGTSASSPSFASIMALVVQKTGSAQGNANPVFYSMANNQLAGGTAVFHDITTGDNTVPNTSGFAAGVGYDQSTGWGSVDVANLVNFWNNNAPGPNFSVSATPSSQSVVQGNSTSYTVNVAVVNGYSNTVSFSLTGLPTGASFTFSPTSITAPGSTSLAVTTATTTPAGTYTLTITGTDGTITHTTTVTLVVAPTPDYTLTVSPASQSLAQGSSANFAVNIGVIGSYTGTISGFTVTGLPAGVTAAFNPTSVVAPGTATLTLTAATTTALGTYTLTISGTDGTTVHSATVTLTVSTPVDFSITAFPPSRSIQAGTNTGYGITVTPQSGFSGVVVLGVSGLPAGATASISPSSLVGSGTATLTINTALTAAQGTFVLTITGTSGTLSHSTTVTLTINPPPPPDFTLTADPSTVTIKRGATGNTTLTVTAQNAFSSTVNLSVGALPALVTGTLNPTSVTTSTSGISVLTLNVDKRAKSGTYTFTVNGSSAAPALSHNVTVTLVIP